jgi:hypothetical protein
MKKAAWALLGCISVLAFNSQATPPTGPQYDSNGGGAGAHPSTTDLDLGDNVCWRLGDSQDFLGCFDATNGTIATTGTADITVNPAGGDWRFLDNVNAAFGTGNDVINSYDGTDYYTDLQNTGTGQWAIGAGVTPFTPEGAGVHIQTGVDTSTAAPGNASLSISGVADDHVAVYIAGGTAVSSWIYWGDTSGNKRAGIGYYRASDSPAQTLSLRAANADILHVDTTGIELQSTHNTIGASGGVLVLGGSSATITSVAGRMGFYSVAGYTAATTQTQAAATNVLGHYSVVETVANADDGVKVPALAAGETGRQIIVSNQGANRMKVYPQTGDDLGRGTNSPVTVDEGDIIYVMPNNDDTASVFISDIPSWGSMGDSQNADAFTINAQDNPHCYHTDGMTNGLSRGFTFDVGGAGTSHAIASIADGGGGEIAVTTSTSHGLAVDDVVSHTGLADAAYEGLFVVNTITSATVYEVTATYTATDTGTVDQCATISADTGSGGTYNAQWHASATNGTNNETIDFVLYTADVTANTTSAIVRSETRRKFGTAADYGSFGGSALVEIPVGGKIAFTLANITGTGTITMRNFGITAEHPH